MDPGPGQSPHVPPILPGPIGPKRHNAAAVGIVGFVFVTIASISSPAAICGLPAIVIAPVGIIGVICCAIGLASKPRWPAVAGLSIAGVCVLVWMGFVLFATIWVAGKAASVGATVPQHAQMSMAAMEIFTAAEAQRQPDGAPPARFDWANVTPASRVDVWAIPYRYAPRPGTARGYTFTSDGPDRLQGTPDDIDLAALGDGSTFPLPPVTTPATGGGGS